jgi:hypothetical protein
MGGNHQSTVDMFEDRSVHSVTRRFDVSPQSSLAKTAFYGADRSNAAQFTVYECIALNSPIEPDQLI